MSLRAPDEPLRVLFVGRLTNWKGVETLLLAAAKMDGIHVTVAGDGPQLPALEALGRQLGLSERLVFTGRLSRPSVRLAMKHSHVLVLTSLYEGLSHTILEAMVAGLPCVVSDRGGNRETIRDGVNGLLVAPQDVPALVESLTLLRHDEALRLRLAQAAKETSLEFQLSKTVEQVLATLRETT